MTEVSPKPLPPLVGVGVYDLEDPPQLRDLSGAGAWRFFVINGGRPLGSVDLLSGAHNVTPAFVEAGVVGRAMHARIRERLIDSLCARMSVPRDPEPDRAPSVSVVVCTHGRPDHLPRCLASLAELDPAPSEVIVVDNDPGPRDSRALIDGYGFTYVREDRRGLDNARNAGVRAASGELVMFTDDDCVVSPGWLRALAVVFADPSVGAVTGPMFPYRLQTRSQVRMESVAGMGRGFWRRAFDWQTITPVHAAAIGVGANMGFRRADLRSLGDEPFPAELDAGTATESGGDTYVIARLVAGGRRIVYTPALYGFHDHRLDPTALRRAVRGYGVGISAAMSKLLVEDRELDAWRGWAWLFTQHVRAQRRRLVDRTPPGEVRASIGYMKGGLLGPRRWREALREQSRHPRSAATALRAPSAGPAPGDASSVARSATEAPRSEPVVTIVIPTRGRVTSLARCLDSLGGQSVGMDTFEVILVDDNELPGTLGPALAAARGVNVRVLASGRQGASAARNLGAREARTELILFMDDDMVASPTLLERHLDRHRDRAGVAVVGAYWPAPPQFGLAASAVGLWWSQTFESMRLGGRPTFMWMLSGNLSVLREHFFAVGGFPDDIPYRREDWDLGMRWLNAGHEIVYAPDAWVDHEFSQCPADRLRGAELEGFGDAVLSRKYPGISGVLPIVGHRDLAAASSARRVVHRVLRSPFGYATALRLLDGLERANLRSSWMRLFGILQSVAYKAGLERAGRGPGETRETVVTCELLSEKPFGSPGPIAPSVDVTLGGEKVVRVRPFEGFWNAAVADQIAYALDDPTLERVGAHHRWVATREGESDARGEVRVVSSQAIDMGPQMEARFLAWLPGPEAASDPRWIDEALVAFDDECVSVVFGTGVGDDRPLQPLYLHDRGRPPTIAPGESPSYVIARSRLLEQTGVTTHAATRDPLCLLGAALAAGATVARRDVHGLPRRGARPVREGREYARAQRAYRQGGAPVLAQALATAAWSILRHRGRPPVAELGFDLGRAVEALVGTARAVLTPGSARAGGRSAADPSRRGPRGGAAAATGSRASRPTVHS
jgi:glycosyltransferase involved in cell wall biosynthesis